MGRIHFQGGHRRKNVRAEKDYEFSLGMLHLVAFVKSPKEYITIKYTEEENHVVIELWKFHKVIISKKKLSCRATVRSSKTKT